MFILRGRRSSFVFPLFRQRADRDSIFDKVTIVDILRLARRPSPNTKGFFQCPHHASHRHGDRKPTAHIVPNTGDRNWTCFRCPEIGGGLVALIVALGLAHDPASAARWLEEFL